MFDLYKNLHLQFRYIHIFGTYIQHLNTIRSKLSFPLNIVPRVIATRSQSFTDDIIKNRNSPYLLLSTLSLASSHCLLFDVSNVRYESTNTALPSILKVLNYAWTLGPPPLMVQWIGPPSLVSILNTLYDRASPLVVTSPEYDRLRIHRVQRGESAPSVRNIVHYIFLETRRMQYLFVLSAYLIAEYPARMSKPHKQHWQTIRNSFYLFLPSVE